MPFFRYFQIISLTLCSSLCSSEFTISSYNAGGLSSHYDYLRAAVMQKLMQERYTTEPVNMSLNEKIQKLALKITFSEDPQEKALAEEKWTKKNYQEIFEQLTSPPTEANSPNTAWHQKADEAITSYKIKPVTVHDQEILGLVKTHLENLTKGKTGTVQQLLTETRAIMAKKILEHELKFDIICLQEADYLNASMFPSNYKAAVSPSPYSKNGVVWNQNRFELIKILGDIVGRGYAVNLQDKETGKTITVASGHLTGCNPYRQDLSLEGKSDSAKGDEELKSIIDFTERQNADLMLLGLDSNVTSLHPRLQILKEAGYRIDYKNFLSPTCANPYQMLNTRIDWIVAKAHPATNLVITNIPVLNVALNSIETNISDHRPIAAKISY